MGRDGQDFSICIPCKEERKKESKEIIEAIRRIKGFFTAPKTIIFFIGLILVACLAGVLIPQIPDATPAYFDAWRTRHPYGYYLVTLLQLNRVFTSYGFFLLILLLLLSITFSVRDQFVKALRGFRTAPTLSGSPDTVFTADHFSISSLREAWTKEGWNINERQEDNTLLLHGAKNGKNVWGSFIFHSGILLLIIASLLTFACQKRGFVQLIEGDTFLGREEGFLSTGKGIFAGRFDPAFTIHLVRFSPTYWDTGELKEAQSDITADRRGLPIRTSLHRGTPLAIGGVALYQSADFGYTLKISYLAGGKTGDAIPTYFSLGMAPAGKPLQGTSDFPTTDYVLDMSFFPDRGGRSPYPVNPSLDVRFLKGEREVARAALKPGEDTLVGRDRFRFEEVRNWSGLILAENRFIPLVYAGFLMSTAGLFMMFFFVPQEILVSRTVEKDGALTIAVTAKTRMGNRALSADVVEHIKEALGREETKG